MLDRRQALKAALGGVGTFALTRSAFGRQSGVTRLTDSLSLLTDVGTNVLVLSQPDGLVLVDSGSAAFTSVLMGHLAALDPQGRARVDTVFNTHYHTDHTGCNEALTPLGASIVAHENTRLWMATDYWVPA